MATTLNACWKAPDTEAIKIIQSWQADLESIRQDYEPLWQDIIDYLAFNRFNFLQNKQKGQKANTLVYDGSPVSAWKMLVTGIQGNVIAQSQRWFTEIIPNVLHFPRTSPMRKYSGRLDQIPDVKVWLEEKEDQTYAALNRSNFYSEANMMIADASSIGTAHMFTEEYLTKQKINFLCMNPGECYIGKNRYGEVDTMFRKFSMTAREAGQMFEVSKMDPGLKNAVENAPNSLYNFIHAVFPRDDIEMYFGKDGRYQPKLGTNNMPWVSMYIQGGNTSISSAQSPSSGGASLFVLKRSGYRFDPFITWRWSMNSEEIYGRSPAMDAIVDIFRLNVMGKTMLLARQKMVEPAMLVHEKFRNRLKLNPRGVNYYSAGRSQEEMIKPIQQGIQIGAGTDGEDRITKIIENHFMTPFFTMLWKAAMEGSQLSVPQVLEMMGEKASIMMPVLERMESDFLSQVISTTDIIETDAGRMPDIPPILQEYASGLEIPIQYNGALATAQRRWAKAQGVIQGTAMLENLWKIFPESADVVDPTATALEVLNVSGWPAKGIRTVDEIMKVRKDRAEQMAQQKKEEQQEKLIQNAAGLSQMAKTAGSMIPQGGGMPGQGGMPGGMQ